VKIYHNFKYDDRFSIIIYFSSINIYRKPLQSMTKLGEYLILKSVNKSEVARKTGLSKARLSELTLKEKAWLRAEELYIIALAIGVEPCEILEFTCGHLRKKK
jgi:DNA-binding Xre family transcriptional regulator